MDKDLDNNNWSSIDQAWASFEHTVSVLPAELDAELVALLPQLGTRTVEALCSHKSVSTTVIGVIETLGKKLGNSLGPWMKTILPGWENLLQRSGLVTHGPGGRAMEHLLALSSVAPMPHVILPWISGLLESNEGFKKNPVAKERGMKVALAFAKELILEETRKAVDVKAAENIVRVACADPSVAVRDAARELWPMVTEHQTPEKIKL